MTTSTSPEFSAVELEVIANLCEDYVMFSEEADSFGIIFVRSIMDKAQEAVDGGVACASEPRT